MTADRKPYLGDPPHPPRDDQPAMTLPCPFCGRADLLDVERHPESGFLCVRCRACGGNGPAGRSVKGEPLADHEATAHWNRRAVAANPAPGAPPIARPFAPVSDHRLAEIAAGEWGPNRQEGKSMAIELLDARDAQDRARSRGAAPLVRTGYLDADGRWQDGEPPRAPPPERHLAAALRSLLEDLGLAPSGTGSEDLGILELEVRQLRTASRRPDAPPRTPDASRCATCGAALPLPPGRPGCAECSP